MEFDRADDSSALCHLILIGPMGVGKTTCGQRLADRTGRRFLDSDATIE